MSSFTLIRGDTFNHVGTYCNRNKRPIDLTDVVLEASAYSADGEFSEVLTVSKLNQVTDKGKFNVTAGPTDDWPVSVLNLKISKTIAGVKSSIVVQFEVRA